MDEGTAVVVSETVLVSVRTFVSSTFGSEVLCIVANFHGYVNVSVALAWSLSGRAKI